MKILSKPTRTISKIDAACRQLESAITLYFQGGDIIAVHTLACAAHQIVHDINQHKNGKYAPELLFNSLNFKDEYRGLLIKHLHKGYNFFKHANKDPDPNGEIEFNPKSTEIFMLFAIKGLSYLGVPNSNKMTAFMIYIRIHNPEFFTDNILFEGIPIDTIKDLRRVHPSEFLDEFLHAWSQ